jgi:epsilon-lactone hydrolase
MSDDRPVLHVPARDIPIPTSVSAEAQAVLAMPPMAGPELPPLDDVDGWRRAISAHNEAIAPLVVGRTAGAAVTTVERDLGGFTVHDIRPEEVAEDDPHVYIDIHGGAFVFGAGDMCRATGIGAALRYGARVWAVDYRMPPDHPFPTGVDDCLAGYRELLTTRRADQIIIGGASAGGNLAAATVLRARDEGLPMPAGVVLMTPGVDLTQSGDSLQTNRGLDPLLSGGPSPELALYALGHDTRDPYLSPLFADYAKGFPPTILTTGTRDLLLSDTVRMHRALRAGGVDAQLHVMEAGGHGGFFGMAPEDQAIIGEVRAFVDARWGRT